MKRRIYQLHSWFGLVAGLGFFVVGLIGSLLVFKEEIDRLSAPAILALSGTFLWWKRKFR